MDKKEKETLMEAVYEIVKTIPKGRATSYGSISKAIGYPNHSRLVGKIMAECNSAETGVPAHRVVNSQGVLSGKEAFGDSGEMYKLLRKEGVKVLNNRISKWKTIFWNPQDEIHFSE